MAEGTELCMHECVQRSFYQRPQRKAYASRWQNHPLTNTIKEASRISERKQDLTRLDSLEDSMAEGTELCMNVVREVSTNDHNVKNMPALRWQNHPLTNTIKARISERKQDLTRLNFQEDSMAKDAALTRWYKDDNIYGYFGDNRLDWYITMTNTWTSVLLLSSCNAHAFGQISFNV
jgi:hypothetical protein